MKRYFLVASLLIAAFQLTRAHNNSKEEVSVEESRSYAHTVVMAVECKTTCPQNMTWKYRKHGESEWNDVTNVTQHKHHKDLYHLRGFQSNTMYEFQVIVGQNNYTSNKPVHTCREHPPGVTDLYVARSGVGWLDIRWNHPKEKCTSEIRYMLRYKAHEGKYTKEIQYGFFDVPKSQGGPRPYHQCQTWPHEFCVLLTDSVQPGKKHTVLVRAVRFDPDDDKKLPASKWSSLVAFADATHYENILPNKCRKYTSTIEYNVRMETSRTSRSDVFVQLWVLILAGVVIAIAVFIALFAAKKAWMSRAISPGSSESSNRGRPGTHSSDQSEMYDYPRLRLQNLRSTLRNRNSGDLPLCSNQIN